MKINGRKIGDGATPYIIAEMSGNHNMDIKRAFKIIAQAKSSGADAVKLQTYKPETITLDHDSEEFIIKSGLWAGRKFFDLYAEAMTPWAWHKDLFEYAKDIDITIFSSPFDFTAVDLLEQLGAPAYKIASFEIIDIPLIKYVAQTGKPIIISTGLANEEEISEALDAAGEGSRALLHCVSGYPSPYKDMNLATMIDMKDRYSVVTGLSDHSMGIAVPVAATVMGASIIEKHMTLSRADGGIDSDFSLEALEFKQMVDGCRHAFDAIGYVNYDLKESEANSREYRRSIYICEDMKKGDKFTRQNVRSIRPGYGLHPRYLDKILGRKSTIGLKKGSPLSWEMIEDE